MPVRSTHPASAAPAVAITSPVGPALVLALAFLIPITAGAAAHAQGAPALVSTGPCGEPECRQFDFWIGDWDVFTAEGKLAGTNRVERILGGCVVQENWVGNRGNEGKSFNLYTPADGKWHQTWVDSQGTLLELAGSFVGGKMVLEGNSPGTNGASVLNRITWEKLPDGRVLQHWEVSPDGGQKWTDAFVGYYTAKKKSAGERKP